MPTYNWQLQRFQGWRNHDSWVLSCSRDLLAQLGVTVKHTTPTKLSCSLGRHWTELGTFQSLILKSFIITEESQQTFKKIVQVCTCSESVSITNEGENTIISLCWQEQKGCTFVCTIIWSNRRNSWLLWIKSLTTVMQQHRQTRQIFSGTQQLRLTSKGDEWTPVSCPSLELLGVCQFSVERSNGK